MIRHRGSLSQRFVRVARSLRADRSMVFAMPCAQCPYELTADDLALVPQMSARFKEHVALAHVRDTEPGHQTTSGR